MLYLILPIILSLLQTFYTLNSLNNIRYEEYTESISGTFWLQKGYACDNNTFIGWYIPLLALFETFGFNFFIPKLLRLLLQIISLFAIAILLKKYLGSKNAILPLLTIGMSPTILYFTTIQATIGFDLTYFPICLFLIDWINFKVRYSSFFKQILLGIVGMIALMTYSALIYYLPILISFYLYKLLKIKDRKLILRNLSIVLVSFLLPLILVFVFIHNKSDLIYNPVTQSGIFRGNGKFTLNSKVFLENVQMVWTDLFLFAQSYYFEVAKVEFSDIYPLFSIFLVAFMTVLIFIRKKKYRPLIILLSINFIFGLIFSNLAGPSGGIRRSTVLLSIFYLFFILSFYVFSTEKKIKGAKRLVGFGLFSILFLHHILVYPQNLVNLKEFSPFRENRFMIIEPTAEKSLKSYLDRIQKADISIGCIDQNQNPVDCPTRFGLNIIYPAVLGACRWNDLSCHKLKYFDPKLSKLTDLDMSSCLRGSN